MPTGFSALQLVLTADPALIAIVRLSLRRLSRARPLPWAGGGHRRDQCPHGAAAGRGRASGLPSPVARGPARILGPPIHTAGDDRRADRADRADHRGADAADA